MFVRVTLLISGLFWAASLFGAEPGEEIAKLTGPQITYFGSDDIGVPSTKLLVPLAENNRKRKDDLERLGWRVVEIPGYDHESLLQDSSGLKEISSLLLNELEPHQW